MFVWNCVFLFDRVSISATIYLASSPWASPPTKPYCAIHQESLSLCLCRHGNRRAWLPLTFWPSVRQRFRLTQRHPEVASSTSKRRTSNRSWIKYRTRYSLKFYVHVLICWYLIPVNVFILLSWPKLQMLRNQSIRIRTCFFLWSDSERDSE